MNGYVYDKLNKIKLTNENLDRLFIELKSMSEADRVKYIISLSTIYLQFTSNIE